MNATKGRPPVIVERRQGGRRLPPAFASRSSQPEFEESPEEFPEVRVDDDIIPSEPQARTGGRFAAAEALFKKPNVAVDTEVERAADEAAQDLVNQTEIKDESQPTTTEGRRILPNLTQAPDPVDQMLAEQPVRKPRGRRPKSAQPMLDLGAAPAAPPVQAEPETAEPEIADTSDAQPVAIEQPQMAAAGSTQHHQGFIARRQQTARSRYDKGTAPAFNRGEGWKKRLPRFAR